MYTDFIVRERNKGSIPFFSLLAVSLCLIGFVSCPSVSKTSGHPSPATDTPSISDTETEPLSDERLVMTFAGDIMAHDVNYKMKDYSLIYEYVSPYLRDDDLTFGNFEMPIANHLPMSNYPRFNVHSSYLEAAIHGGFDVFSAANNHSNDQYADGMRGTRESFANFAGRIHWTGLYAPGETSMKPILIEKKGWRVLFLAITEILNTHDSSAQEVYFVSPKAESRLAFLAELERMRKESACDVFILSLHSAESEYVRTVAESKKKWFSEIANAGVDIVWAHHPHVMQGWEMVDRKFFMYSMGNFVSGQRYRPDYDNPQGVREYTGDSALLRLTFSRKAGSLGYDSIDASSLLVTNLNLSQGGVTVRVLDEALIGSVTTKQSKYLRKRMELMNAYLPLLPPLTVTAILEE